MFDFLGSYQSLIFSIIITVVLLILAVAFFKLFQQVWLFYKQSLFKNSIEWAFLELRIPREVLKTPRAMDQFFMNLYGMRNAPGDFLETYIEGEVTLWWSFELASFGGKIHFYIRTPKKHKKIIEAALYAQYPNIEVIEVEDYLNKFPDNTKEFYESNENIFGSEFHLAKDDFYPITTYEQFELTKEELAIDPLSAFIEALANIHKEENVFIQILVAPAGPEWKKKGEEFINKFLDRDKKKKGGGFNQILSEWVRNLLWAPTEHPVWSETKESENKDMLKSMTMWKLTPGEQDIIKAIENKLSKQGFEVLVRFLYIAPNNIFNINFARKGLLGAFNQYASQSLNSFRNNVFIETRTKWNHFPYIFVSKRVEARKQRLLYNFRNRLLPEKLWFSKFFTSHIFDFNNKSKSYTLVTSELATLYHIPAEQVLTSPHMERAESKKMGPPAGLPIFEEE